MARLRTVVVVMKDIKKLYWKDFVKWCKQEKAGIDPDDEMEAISIELKTQLTDENFMNWYMENIG